MKSLINIGGFGQKRTKIKKVKMKKEFSKPRKSCKKRFSGPEKYGEKNEERFF